MKRLILLIFSASLLFTSISTAAPTLIPVKELKLVATVGNTDEINGVLATGTSIIVYGTKREKSYARAINFLGEEQWTIDLDLQLQSIATTASLDSAGNIWIAGSISQSIQTPTPTPNTTPLNPDKVNPVSDDLDTSLRNIALWRIEPNSHVVTRYVLNSEEPVLITSLAVDKSGVTLAGIASTEKGNAGFVVSGNLSGEFEKPLMIGNTSTTLDSVVRHSDGSLTVVGSSSEVLNGKKLVGISDGIIVKISKAGKVVSLVRSSAVKASRNWNSASSSLLLGGEIISPDKIESAVTKFSSSFAPLWNYRFASTGQAFTSGSTFALFASTGQIPQLAKWKPKSARPIVLTFDSKGVITAASSAPSDQREALGLVISKTLGVLCVSASSETISIFSLK